MGTMYEMDEALYRERSMLRDVRSFVVGPEEMRKFTQECEDLGAKAAVAFRGPSYRGIPVYVHQFARGITPLPFDYGKPNTHPIAGLMNYWASAQAIGITGTSSGTSDADEDEDSKWLRQAKLIISR